MARARFSGKGVIVTGGSSGLGRALAERLAADHARVALVARNPARLERARAEILAAVPQATVLTAALDVAETDTLDDEFVRLADELGGIDILINSAGILREGYFEQLSVDAFREVIEINYFGLLRCVKAALPHIQARRGRIVNIASLGGLSGTFGYTAYNSSKFAVVGLSEALRYELAPQGVSVHLVCPPEFESPMVDALDRTRTPENRAHTLTIPKYDIDTIARDTLRGVGRGSFLIVPGSRARLAAGLVRHLPGVSRSLSDARVRRVYRGPPQPPQN